MVADVVATPVFEGLAGGVRDGVVRAATPVVAYLDLGGFVVALTAPGVPLMPNGVAVARTAVADGPVRAAPTAIAIGDDEVTWDLDTPRWEPALRRALQGEADALADRGRAMLDALGARSPWDDGGLATVAGRRAAEGTSRLRRALVDRDAGEAARAADILIGLGAGLTPEGDDVLTAVAAVVWVVRDAFAFEDPERWVAALVPPDRGRRTTALSATLLGLGAQGRIAEPVHPLLDPAAPDWRGALGRLTSAGASTGRAYALAVGATLSLLGSEPERCSV